MTRPFSVRQSFPLGAILEDHGANFSLFFRVARCCI